MPKAPEPFETLRWEAGAPAAEAGGFVRLGAHLSRLTRACNYLAIAFSATEARARLLAAAQHFEGPTRVRLLVTRSGALHLTSSPLDSATSGVLDVGVAFERVNEDDPLRRHKTTAREVYDLASKKAAVLGLADIIFLNLRDNVAEGAISNVFVRRGAILVTPPVSAGALPGVLRGALIATGECVEAEVSLANLEKGDFYLGSSLRGLRPARLAPGIVSVATKPN
ncbi:MAG TPA: aminotransferase class IV [Trueperaceae bacterium]|nr:aminotransferase class IV [Trueperaceae bacterium]